MYVYNIKYTRRQVSFAYAAALATTAALETHSTTSAHYSLNEQLLYTVLYVDV